MVAGIIERDEKHIFIRLFEHISFAIFLEYDKLSVYFFGISSLQILT